MAIFGIFGKKNDPPPAGKPSTTRRTGDAARAAKAGTSEREQQAQRSVALANATARKIDAIESEMSSEFVPSTLINTQVGAAATPTTGNRSPLTDKSGKTAAQTPSFEMTLPTMGMSTEFLLGADEKSAARDVASTDSTPPTDEAAILFASGQSEVAEHVLLATIGPHSDSTTERTAWAMLFDLYQFTNNHSQYENLSIEFASKFETSPPAWVAPSHSEVAAPVAPSSAVPSVAFTGKLGANIIKLLERTQKLGEKSPVLRLEFTRVTEVDPIGCGLLLRMLKKLQDSQHDLILVGANELLAKTRAILEVGRRDETEAPWLLLMEVFRLLNREQDFEDASMDYCVTFEVSPPAFVAPDSLVTTADDQGTLDPVSDSFVMPVVIEGRTEQLMTAIVAFVSSQEPAILDCSRLSRVDFNAAGQLLSSLAPYSARQIELRNVNAMVTALFSVMGIKDIVRIVPRKL